MSVFISNVDDFIVPGQACVNPLVLNRDNAGIIDDHAPLKQILSIQNDDASDSHKLHLKTDIKPDLIKSKISSSSSSKIASVSLNDCLACRYVVSGSVRKKPPDVLINVDHGGLKRIDITFCGQ